MKHILTRTLSSLFVLIAGVIFSAAGQDSTSIDLRGIAAFRPGDDDVWRSKYIDEREHWNFVTIPGAWEQNGFPLLDGFAWYRIRFRIPAELRNDSLLLVISGIDDADETFLNGVMVGKTGSFPPDFRSEMQSLRVYPLPRFLREEHNLLAIRVYDAGNAGGMTGNIIRIIRPDSMHRVLDEIVDAPPLTPPMFISNGVMASAWQPDSAILNWCRPRLYDRLSAELRTGTVLSDLVVMLDDGVEERALRPDTVHYLDGTGVLHARDGDVAAYWYHPLSTEARILVVAVRQPENATTRSGLHFVMDLPYWRYEEFSNEANGQRSTYHILAYHSCCTELVDRDMEEFLAAGEDAYALEAEIAAWRLRLSEAQYLPDLLSPAERQVYHQSRIALLQLQVQEQGLGKGQLVSALQPGSNAICEPAVHLLAAEALAECGLTDAATAALEFIHRAEHGVFTLYDVYGEEFGVGHPYLVTPSYYDGSANEWRWEDRDQAILRYEGMARYILAVEALRKQQRRRHQGDDAHTADSSLVASFFPQLSKRVADVLMYRLDDAGLLMQDDGPWGEGLSRYPGVHATLFAGRALMIASDHAAVLGDATRSFLYADAAERARLAVLELISDARSKEHAEELSPLELGVFHPLLCDALWLGMIDPSSENARFVFDMIESGFSITDTVDLYRSDPGGDWRSRQARPQIALRLARAYAAAGDGLRAEALFAAVTREASRHNGLLPELVDPVSGNWHGGIPSLATAADYILTAEAIIQLRLGRE
ncbi:MAG: hypothetical protein KFH87_01250 [Bacteroidetes bacterium]|nr:hypothetical protein [Bacteroidota bacterium]